MLGKIGKNLSQCISTRIRIADAAFSHRSSPSHAGSNFFRSRSTCHCRHSACRKGSAELFCILPCLGTGNERINQRLIANDRTTSKRALPGSLDADYRRLQKLGKFDN